MMRNKKILQKLFQAIHTSFLKAKKIRPTPALFVFLVFFYFFYHLLTGQRGLIAFLKVSHNVRKAESQLEETTKKLSILEDKAKRLREESLDKELLEESIRKTLYMGKKDEFMIRDEKDE